VSDTQQMTVTKNPDGSHRPAYNAEWPERTHVEWAVGVAAVETGLRITVTPASEIRTGVVLEGAEDGPERYHLRIQGEWTSLGCQPGTARELYAFLDGMQAAVKVTRGY
jgi:hypothetical protein